MAGARNKEGPKALILSLAIIGLSAAPLAASARQPVAVELFQSQGCSSCPPANAILNRLADRPDLLPLNFSVALWDQLGSNDRFGHPAYAEGEGGRIIAARRL